MFADIKNDVKEVLVDLFDVNQDYLQSQVKTIAPIFLTKGEEHHISIKDL